MIAVAYHIVAHYRYPVFKELSNSKEFEFVILSGRETPQQIVTVDPGLAGTPLSKGGLNWEFVRNIWLYKDLILWQKGLIRKCMNRKFTAFIFLGDMYYISTWICALILKIQRRRVYFWTHGAMRIEKGLKGWLRKRFYSLADGFFLYGNYAAGLLEKQGLPRGKMEVIYNSLDHKEQVRMRNSGSNNSLLKEKVRNPKSPAFPQIVFIGRLIKEKQVDLLIETVNYLRDRQYMINVLIVGDGREEAALKAMVTRYALSDQIYFYGPSYDEAEIYHLISKSDICVSPGGVGLNVMHSLVYGTPVITHDDMSRQGPEVEAIEPGITGDLFSYGDKAELGNCIQQWVAKHSDRNKVREACYKAIDSKYTPQHQHRLICSRLKNDQMA